MESRLKWRCLLPGFRQGGGESLRSLRRIHAWRHSSVLLPARCIERHLSDTPGDPDMLYYRGIYRYLTKDYSQAIEDCSAVADDCTRRVGGLIPLWELATLRKGQMLDLLGEREAALRAYQKVAREGTEHLKDIVSSFLKEPFARPLPASAGGTW